MMTGYVLRSKKNGLYFKRDLESPHPWQTLRAQESFRSVEYIPSIFTEYQMFRTCKTSSVPWTELYDHKPEDVEIVPIKILVGDETNGA